MELAKEVIAVTGSRSEIVFEALPTDDPQVRQPDISLAREILGWEPEVGLAEGLRRTIEQSGSEGLVGTGALSPVRTVGGPRVRRTPSRAPTGKGAPNLTRNFVCQIPLAIGGGCVCP